MAFKDIIEQESAVRTLKNIILRGKIGGGYLFLGPEGAGKKLAAINFAKAINCERLQGDACDQCISCKKLDNLNHPDVFLIEREPQAFSIKIDTMRDIIYQASLKPYEAEYKVFIIIDAWTLTEEAANSLLKILEEPPRNQIFILTSSDLTRLFPTIISRCQIVRFGRLGIQTIKNLLIERFGLEQNLANLIAHISGQDLSRAIELKDRDFVGLRDTALKRTKIDPDEFKNRDTLKELLILLLDWYRDILILKFMDVPSGLINIDRYQEILYQSRRFSVAKVEENIKLLFETLDYIRNNVNPRLALEVLNYRLRD